MKTTLDFEFPQEHERGEIDEQLGALLRAARRSIAEGSVSPTIELTAFRRQLNNYSFDQSHDFRTLLDWTVDSLSKGLVHMTHPGYFGLFNPSPTFASECADRIVASFNPQICVWSHAPVAVEIEKYVIEQICQRIGYTSSGDGHFTSGGSEANFTSVSCALTNAHPKFDTLGARAFSGQPRLYVSKESHLAWLKIAHQTGIGRDAVCLVETDGFGRMRSDALQAAIESDLAKGGVPFFIGATAGTTNAGQVDPLVDCAHIAQKFNLWFHVDAAWGGALISDPQLAQELEGIDRADSITIDAHKWFATTMGAGMFLTRHPPILRETFRVTASYMPSHNAQSDYYLNSMQWSRRFIGLRLFLSLAAGGWQAQVARIQRGNTLIKYLTQQAERQGWRVACESKMALVCLSAPPGIDVSTVVNTIVEAGKVWVSVAQFEGESVLRACITHGETTQKQIDQLVQFLPTG